MRSAWLAGSLMLAAPHAAADPQVLDCGRLLDVASGRMQERVAVVVEGGRITAIQPQADAPGARVDLNHLTCLPGLMDMHVHLTGETQKQADAFRDELTA